MRKNFNAKVSITFPSSSEERYAEIRIKDGDSGCGIAEVRLSMEQFAMALSCCADRPATGELYDNFDRVGKTLEVKEEWLRVNKHYLNGTFGTYSRSKERTEWLLKSAQATFNKDGWEVDISEDFNNGYRQKNDGDEATLFKVCCRRYV